MTKSTHPNKEYKNYKFIPTELKEYDQWVYWQIERHHGNPTKVPYDANTRERASTDNPKTWSTYDQAYRVLTRCKGIDGIGFVFSTNDPYIGVDWDDIRDPITGVIDEKILSEEIIPLGSYAEVSPSGTGVHLIGKGMVPGDRRKGKNREIYDTGRYFTITGMHIEGTPLTIEKVSQDPLNLVYDTMVGDHTPQKIVDRASLTGNNSFPEGRTTPLEIGDEGIITLCLLAKNGVKFRELFEFGSSRYGSHSEADLALCGILGFYTQDKAQMDRIFRQSSLYRPKWDEKHGTETYGELTIRKALSGTRDHFSWVDNTDRGSKWKIPIRKSFDVSSGEDQWQM